MISATADNRSQGKRLREAERAATSIIGDAYRVLEQLGYDHATIVTALHNVTADMSTN